MKIASLFLVVAVFLGGAVQAQVKDTPTEVSFELKDSKEVRQIYQYLGLSPRPYKLFTDKIGATSFFCDLQSQSPRCVLTLRKMSSTNTTEIYHEAGFSRVTLYDQDDAKTLYKALLVRGLIHGDYEIRALADEAMNFSISCMEDLGQGTGTSCQLMIFKKTGNGLPIFGL